MSGFKPAMEVSTKGRDGRPHLESKTFCSSLLHLRGNLRDGVYLGHWCGPHDLINDVLHRGIDGRRRSEHSPKNIHDLCVLTSL
jgi:hypothetical protein